MYPVLDHFERRLFTANELDSINVPGKDGSFLGFRYDEKKQLVPYNKSSIQSIRYPSEAQGTDFHAAFQCIPFRGYREMAMGTIISQFLGEDMDYGAFNAFLICKESLSLDGRILNGGSVENMAQVVVLITRWREQMQVHFNEALTKSPNSADPLFPYIQMRILVEYYLQVTLVAVERTAGGEFDTSVVLNKWHGLSTKINKSVRVTNDRFTSEGVLVGLDYICGTFNDPKKVRLTIYESDIKEYCEVVIRFCAVEGMVLTLDRYYSKL